jgi:hypothetical protein
MLRFILRDGREETVRSYRIEGDVVHLTRADGSGAAIDFAALDLAATFRASAGVEFAPAAAPIEPGEPVLELVAQSRATEGDYLVLEGLVRNLAREDQPNVVARVIAEDGEGRFLTSEEVLIDWNPLRPGADSTFRVVLRAAGRAAATRLEFRSLLGGALATRGL